MGKLLVWRATVFLLRYEQGKLTIQRVDVDATDKKVSLHPCDVSLAEKSTAIPADARLVAAQEVEDSVLAIRYPVLIFQSAAEVSELSTSGNSPSRKRRRFVNSSEKLSSNSSPEASSKTEGQLFFYILYEKEDKELSIQLLNVLETPLSSDAEELQVFVTDGPFVLLFDRSAQSTVALKLQRSRTGGKEGGFYVWREGVDVTSGTETEVVVVSCTYVSETHSSRPHILIHTKILPPSDR
ncbi:hypothetical protein PHYBOEH_008838 [Phytophthora boehmeriae]|uniref:Uncharacterized protein n=1 Tax=Phytophthora boehmeriae TaxID=109152 RepID=A0A8T1X193_9STRA|nr:hypothetical protein PHYBOEH_008838 [Phytophthora boehmeriae]